MKTITFLKTLQLLLLTIVCDSLLGQANVNLSNLSTTAVNQHLLPGNNNNRNLGSVGKSWKDIYTDGNIYLDDIVFITNKNIVNNTFVGASAGNVTTGIANTGIGYQSMLFNTFGAYNTGVGQSALLSNTAGNFNSALGVNALYSNTTGSYNTASGYQALNYNISGDANTAVGLQALFYNTTASNNIAVGHKTLFSNTTGDLNIAVGNEALYSNTTSSHNTAIGFKSLYTNSSGIQNVAIGNFSLSTNSTGYQNTANGYQALYSNSTGYLNTALGSEALYSNSTGFHNTASGVQALYSNTTGSYNIANGYQALYSNMVGTDNIAIGEQALFLASSYANIAIGSYALYGTGTASQNIAIGQQTMMGNISGYYNTAIGHFALEENTGGSWNIAMGHNAMHENSTGSSNTALGISALYYNTIGNSNVAVGYNAALHNTTGVINTAIGISALFTNTNGTVNTATGGYALYQNDTGDGNTGDGAGAGDNYFNDNNYCTFIGHDADQNALLNYTNSTALGYASRITADNQVRIGNSSVTSIGGYAAWTNLSDERMKKNIKEDVPGLEFINQLRPVTYTLDVNGIRTFLEEDKTFGDKSIENMRSNNNNIEIPANKNWNKEKENIVYTGFLAQEVEASAEKIGYDFSGVDKPENETSLYGIRYAEFVVPLVKAVQELDEMNKELQSENDALKTRLDRLESLILNNNTGGIRTEQDILLNGNTISAKLEQNIPNPFNGITSIKYFVPENSMSAQIRINNNQGIELKVFNISTGEGTITLHASELPSGNYSYSLIMDGRIIDTKNLIITK